MPNAKGSYLIDCAATDASDIIRSLNNIKARMVKIVYSEDDSKACIMYSTRDGKDNYEEQEILVSNLSKLYDIEALSFEGFSSASVVKKNLMDNTTAVYDDGAYYDEAKSGRIFAKQNSETDEDEDEEEEEEESKVKCPQCNARSTPDEVKIVISINYSMIEYYSGTAECEEADVEVDSDGDWTIAVSSDNCEANDGEIDDGYNLMAQCTVCGCEEGYEEFGIYDVNVD